jgi:hypothetical protein
MSLLRAIAIRYGESVVSDRITGPGMHEKQDPIMKSSDAVPSGSRLEISIEKPPNFTEVKMVGRGIHRG